MEDSFKRNAVSASIRYLERRGYEVLERDYSCECGDMEIIAEMDGNLVFCNVYARDSNQKALPKEFNDEKTRERFEGVAISYLTDHDFPDAVIRYDVLALTVIGPDRALIRHHSNALGA